MKDTTNLLDYNTWSGSDYNENVSNIPSMNNANIISSKYWSSNGESSIKCVRTHNTAQNVTRLGNLTLTVGATVTATLTVYSPNNTVVVTLYDGTVLAQTNVPQSNTAQTVTLSGVLTATNVDVRLSLAGNGDFVFVDNVIIASS